MSVILWLIKKLKEWSTNYKNINIVEGYWQKELHNLGNFDFIFFDDYPLHLFDEINEENSLQVSLQNNRFDMFIDICFGWHMEVGSTLSGYMEKSVSLYENEKFTHHIINNPKIDYSEKIIDVKVPSNCNYYRGGDKALIPIIKKIS